MRSESVEISAIPGVGDRKFRERDLRFDDHGAVHRHVQALRRLTGHNGNRLRVPGRHGRYRYGKPDKGRLQESVNFHVTCLSDHASRNTRVFSAHIARTIRELFFYCKNQCVEGIALCGEVATLPRNCPQKKNAPHMVWARASLFLDMSVSIRSGTRSGC